MANLEDLKGKSADELGKAVREEQARVDKLCITLEPGFGKSAGKELAPVTDEDIQKAIEELDKAIKIKRIADLQLQQNRLLEDVRRRTEKELSDASETRKPLGHRSDEGTSSKQPVHYDLRQQSRMYKPCAPCAQCGKEDFEVPFQPTPGKPIYCQDCYQQIRRSQGSFGHAFKEKLEEQAKTINSQAEQIRNLELRLTAVSESDTTPRLSKKQQRRLDRKKKQCRQDGLQPEGD